MITELISYLSLIGLWANELVFKKRLGVGSLRIVFDHALLNKRLELRRPETHEGSELDGNNKGECQVHKEMWRLTLLAATM